jgi:hypothetical protein
VKKAGDEKGEEVPPGIQEFWIFAKISLLLSLEMKPPPPLSLWADKKRITYTQCYSSNGILKASARGWNAALQSS